MPTTMPQEKPAMQAEKHWPLRIILFLTLFALMMGGFSLLWYFSRLQYDQEIRQEALQLQQQVRERAGEAAQWVAGQREAMQRIARHPGMAVYTVSALETLQGGALDAALGHQAYLANYLTVQAEKLGYTKTETLAGKVGANVRQVAAAGGLAVTGLDGQVIAASGLHALPSALQQRLLATPKGEAALLGVIKGESSRDAVLATATPIYPEQALEEQAEQVAWLIGLAPMSPLYALLQAPSETGQEFSLLHKRGAGAEFLSPHAGIESPLTLADKRDQPAQVVVKSPEFRGLLPGRGEREWLVAGAPVPETDWVALGMVEAQTVLAPAQENRLRLLAIGVLLILCILVILVAVWRHVRSVQTAREAERYQLISQKLAGQKQLLRCVSDIQPDPMLICDGSGVLRFANAALEGFLRSDAGQLTGRTLAECFGPELSDAMLNRNRQALEGGQPCAWNLPPRPDSGVCYRLRHIPVRGLPDLFGDANSQGVLILWQDVTLQQREQQRLAATHRQLLNVLLSLLDLHDPYAAQHSRRVAELSAATAEAMGLEDSAVETARLAGGLANIGKILTPQELLTKKEALTDPEKHILAEAQEKAMRLLGEVDFSGPVAEVIRQAGEHWDGSGRLGRRGEEILPEARVVAVANACIAMVSDRAFRQAMDKASVEEELLRQADSRYNRAAVAALLHVLETGKLQVIS